MKRIAWLIAVALVAAVVGGPPAAAEDQKPGMFVVVTADDPQVQGMAMVLSMQSVQRGAAVRVLLCGPGGDLALKDAPQTALKPKNVTPQGMLTKLMGMGVTAEVCALYLPNNGKTPADLIDGVGVAKPPVIAEALLAPDTRLFTF